MAFGKKQVTITISFATLLIALVALAATGAGGIVFWEQQNSDAFCTNTCHKVHPEEPRAHEQYVHARVQCVECHEGRLPTLHLMVSKLEHLHQLWLMIVGYDRPTRATALRPLRDSCEGCHWPSVVHDDSLRVKVRHDTDAASTETRYRLEMHTGFGAVREKQAKGIHWHIEQEVNYVALDDQNQKMALVEVRGADGKTKTYIDANAGKPRAELEKAPKSRMQCVDCHSSVGHPFRNPADLVDEAIASGEIDRKLPSTKALTVKLIGEAGKLFGTPEELAPQFDKLIADVLPKREQTAATKEQDRKFATAMKRILLQTSFAQKGISWKTFPFNTGHKDFPGCFRCHDGKHLDEKGEAIRFQCTLCHALPKVVREDGARSVASTIDPDMTPPDFHEAPNWMRDHPTRMTDPSCKACHGKIEYGKEGGSFCSNPACHGRTWPRINSDDK